MSWLDEALTSHQNRCDRRKENFSAYCLLNFSIASRKAFTWSDALSAAFGLGVVATTGFLATTCSEVTACVLLAAGDTGATAGAEAAPTEAGELAGARNCSSSVGETFNFV